MPDNTYKAIHNGNTKRYTMEIQMLDATAKYIQSDIKDNIDIKDIIDNTKIRVSGDVGTH